jgi:thymidylate synthase ThyX
MAYSARILKDSLAYHQWPNRIEEGARLTTMEVTFPRIVLAEFNTHRMFSRNSASSRAIPVEKMLKKVQEDPFIPIYWGKNQKGMQAEEELTEDLQDAALETWLAARDHAVYRVNQLLALGIHKQITNRLLEPWLWHTVIVTSTEWDNWRGLRCNKDAQPEIRRIADMMMELLDSSTPAPVQEGDWHLPLVDDKFDLEVAGFSLTDIIKICIGRCCRVSYLTHDGKRDPQADIDLFDRLLKSGHMSPFEHAARPMTRWECREKYGRRGQFILDEEVPQKNFAGNFRGWVQSRKLIANEDNFRLVEGSDRPFELQP